MISMISHLLPSGRAWRLTANKRLKQFFTGISSLITGTIAYIDANTWSLLDPSTTTKLDQWEEQFNLRKGSLSESDRRTRLAAAWSAVGGQSPYYVQNTLRNSGFNVYVYEWWGSSIDRNAIYRCGSPRSICGRDGVACMGSRAETRTPLNRQGYPLVNKIPGITYTIEGTAVGDQAWPYYLYIGGSTFGSMAQVPLSRKDEFEELCLKIKPLKLWLFIMVTYTS